MTRYLRIWFYVAAALALAFIGAGLIAQLVSIVWDPDPLAYTALIFGGVVTSMSWFVHNGGIP